MSIIEVHGRLANSALLFFVLLSVWGFLRFFRKAGVNPAYWGALVIGELLLLVQSGLGAYLWLSGLRPGRSIHLLYGLVSLMALPAVYLYTQGRQQRAEMLMYGTTALITAGLVFRAISTAIG